MARKSRTDILLELCKVAKEPESTTTTTSFSWNRKKSNWFCNRGLSPTPVNDSCTSPELRDKAVESKICQEDNLRNIQPTPTNDFHDQTRQKEEHKLGPGKKIIVHQNITIKAPNNFPPLTPKTNKVVSKVYLPAEKNAATRENTEKQNYIDSSEKRENRDLKSVDSTDESDDEIIPPTPEDLLYKSVDATDENDDEIIPPTPKDPFYTSDSSGSSYNPSDDDDGSSTSILQTSPRITRAEKLQIERGTANIKKGNKTRFATETSLQKPNPQPIPELRKESEVELDLAIDNEKEYLMLSIPEPTEIQENITVSNMQLHETESSSSKTPYIRKRDYCYFCETEVQNFARHIKRNHSLEIAVSEILSKPIKSKERRYLFDNLRRKGNFLASGRECFKAVRQTYVPGRSVLPCDNCLGFFSSKLLYRHRKKCLDGSWKGSAQAAGQSKLIVNSRVARRLKEEVFPHMRADKVSMEAKNDTLICTFGSRYLNTHREKHFVHVTSRKMRELSKILIEVRKLEPSITNMFSALQPKYFDLFVEATKRIARYDVEKDIYMSPTFAMNIATSLKQCCDIAITYAYKKQVPYLSVSSGEAEANLKTLIHLFVSNWRFEVSSPAANNLSLNKWNKVTVIPLASDLQLLRKYLIQVAEDASKKLKENNNTAAYNTLVESVYCRVILLNRKRSGELQRMLLHTYVNCSSEKPQYEEFNKAVSATEQILLKTLKRVVIRGKRGRGVPVLFSADVQNHIGILLEVRQNFVSKENPYLFAKAKSLSHIIGYKILNKYAKYCGAKNPSSITSTRLRKHLATLSQLFSLSENEIEQLATFMGHTLGVHRNSYRLPQEIYQTAKISKLLLLMEKGGANEFKGKSLDQINIDMEEDLLNNDEKSDESDNEDTIDEENLPNPNDPGPSSAEIVASPAPVPKKVKCRTLVPWTTKQKEVVKLFFKNHIKASNPPKRSECEELKSKHPELLQNKDWLKIKVFIQNEYNKKKKNQDD